MPSSNPQKQTPSGSKPPNKTPSDAPKKSLSNPPKQAPPTTLHISIPPPSQPTPTNQTPAAPTRSKPAILPAPPLPPNTFFSRLPASLDPPSPPSAGITLHLSQLSLSSPTSPSAPPTPGGVNEALAKLEGRHPLPTAARPRNPSPSPTPQSRLTLEEKRRGWYVPASMDPEMRALGAMLGINESDSEGASSSSASASSSSDESDIRQRETFALRLMRKLDEEGEGVEVREGDKVREAFMEKLRGVLKKEEEEEEEEEKRGGGKDKEGGK